MRLRQRCITRLSNPLLKGSPGKASRSTARDTEEMKHQVHGFTRGSARRRILQHPNHKSNSLALSQLSERTSIIKSIHVKDCPDVRAFSTTCLLAHRFCLASANTSRVYKRPPRRTQGYGLAFGEISPTFSSRKKVGLSTKDGIVELYTGDSVHLTGCFAKGIRKTLVVVTPQCPLQYRLYRNDCAIMNIRMLATRPLRYRRKGIHGRGLCNMEYIIINGINPVSLSPSSRSLYEDFLPCRLLDLSFVHPSQCS